MGVTTSHAREPRLLCRSGLQLKRGFRIWLEGRELVGVGRSARRGGAPGGELY